MSRSNEVLTIVNLDFEYELAAGPRYTVPPLMAELETQWRSLLRLLPQARWARCLGTGARTPGQTAGADGAALLVWGVTPRTLHLAEQLGLAAEFPPVQVVREINDKRTSHRIEQQLGIALPHSQVVGRLEQFEAAVAACSYDWVLKHPLGLSARERMVGRMGQVSESAWGWARRKFSQGWELLFEPWVEQRDDFSLHFEIAQDGRVSYLGHCQLLPDPGGVYRGNRVTPNLAPDPVALRVGHQVATLVAQRGYWGPVGIDAFTGQLGDRPILRPLVEINARHSFGRMTLALAAWLPSDWCYLWWHPSQSEQRGLALELRPLPEADDLVAGFYALPEWVDSASRSGTVLVVASDSSELEALETRLSIPGLRSISTNF